MGDEQDKSMKRRVDCIILSVSSSVDNFIVGVTLGVQGTSAYSHELNAIVAAANALGAFLSSFVGRVMGKVVPTLAGLGAAAIFLYIGIDEFVGWATQKSSALESLALRGNAWKLALPMTLNNLAGGIAGGVTGIRPVQMGLGAFIASFLFMLGGYYLGRLSSAALHFDPGIIAAIAFTGLGLVQLKDVVRDLRLELRRRQRDDRQRDDDAGVLLRREPSVTSSSSGSFITPVV